jgi:hypothetical protein
VAGMDFGREEDTLSNAEIIEALQKVNSTSGKHRATDRRRENEMMSENATPKAPSVTQQNMAFLEECIDRLFKSAELLGIRLENILTESSPEAASDRRGFGGNSPLSEQLAIFCRRLEDLNDRLSYLTARIDL